MSITKQIGRHTCGKSWLANFFFASSWLAIDSVTCGPRDKKKCVRLLSRLCVLFSQSYKYTFHMRTGVVFFFLTRKTFLTRLGYLDLVGHQLNITLYIRRSPLVHLITSRPGRRRGSPTTPAAAPPPHRRKDLPPTTPLRRPPLHCAERAWLASGVTPSQHSRWRSGRPVGSGRPSWTSSSPSRTRHGHRARWFPLTTPRCSSPTLG